MASVPQTEFDDGRTAVQAVVLDVLRRRTAGEELSDEQVIASRPELAEQLRVELAKLRLICAAGNDQPQSDVIVATTDMRSVRTPGMLQLQCPHCREPFEAETDTPVTEIVCSTCGGQFSLAGDDRETRFATSLKSLAHFDLVERLGVGGFGTVWKARDRKLDRTVAVKIPRQGLLNNEELEKFLREARAAAQLQHPNIVRVHEVGRDGDSVFIVSDFVRGIPLNEWLTGQQPTMRQAAELCIAIADALQHAHDRGVIHRDLKPANILIDGDGRPHLMDFGLARRQVGEVTLTLDGQVLGTPAYMSPEQAQGEAHTADGRTDIYSLGVILFQLLTGELPYRGSARMLMHQVIHEEPPSPRKLNARIPRDLETITLKCLEKDPPRRYQTARALAQDLNRWVKQVPILARPLSHTARAWRWCKRNGAVATLTAIIGATLALGVAISSYFAVDANRQAADARRAKALAEAREREATSVTEYLIGMFEAPAPVEVFGVRLGAGQNAAAQALLKRGGQQLTQQLDAQPAVQAKLKQAIGRAHMGLGNPTKGGVLLEQVLALQRRQLSPDVLEICQTLRELSCAYLLQGRILEAEASAREQLAALSALKDAPHEALTAGKAQLALVLSLCNQSRAAEGEKLWREVLEARRATLKQNDPRLGEALVGVAGCTFWDSETDKYAASRWLRRAEAAQMVTEAIRVFDAHETTRSFGAAITAIQKLLMVSDEDGEAALKSLKSACAGLNDTFGKAHPVSVFAVAMYANALMHFERREDALASYDEMFTMFSETGMLAMFPSMEHSLIDGYAMLLQENGQSERLKATLRAIALKQHELGQLRSQNGILVLEKLAKLSQTQSETAEVVRLYKARIDQQQEALKIGQSHSRRPGLYTWPFATAVIGLGVLLRDCGQFEEAESLYQESIGVLREQRDHRNTVTVLIGWAEVKQAQHDYDEAEIKYRDAVDLVKSSKLSPSWATNPLRIRLTLGLADNLASQKKFVEAEDGLRSVVASAGKVGVDHALSKLAELLKLRQKLQGNDNAETLLAMSKLASAYTSAGQFDASARVQDELCELVLNLSRRVSADESYWAALALLASGKLHEYRRACQLLLRSFEETGNDDFADRAVRASVLAILSESIAKELVAAAEAVKDLSAGNERLLGACLFRTGEYEKGLTAFAESHRKSEPTSWDHCFLAMLHAKLGNDDEAKAALSAALNARKQEGKAEWYSLVEIETLLAEATALIEGSPSGSSKTP